MGLKLFGSRPTWGADNFCESDPYALLKQAKNIKLDLDVFCDNICLSLV